MDLLFNDFTGQKSFEYFSAQVIMKGKQYYGNRTIPPKLIITQPEVKKYNLIKKYFTR
jgi:hypothetical protein